jgi:hypothetical protein
LLKELGKNFVGIFLGKKIPTKFFPSSFFRQRGWRILCPCYNLVSREVLEKAMKQDQNFSQAKLLAAIQEAEELATQIDTLDENGEQMGLIYRWAEMADGVARMMVQAEELLSREDLTQLQDTVNREDSMCWEKYRRNIRWLNKPTE